MCERGWGEGMRERVAIKIQKNHMALAEHITVPTTGRKIKWSGNTLSSFQVGLKIFGKY